MKPNQSSYVFVTVCLAALLIVSMFVAGCTSTGTTTSTAIPSATSTPASAMATQAAVTATTAISTPSVTTTASTTSAQKQSITVTGSTTVLPIAQAAADAYMKAHPDADIQISGGGSGVGVQSIGAKTVDIGMSSRDVTKAELAKYPGLNITTVAHDGIAIIVNPSNTIQYITLDQAKNIYTGKITKWTEISGAEVPNTNNQIVLIGRDSSSGTRTYFDETVLKSVTPAKTMLEQNSNGAVAQSVAQTPGAIGYVSIGFLSSDVKALPIWYNSDKIISPSIATVKNKTYPVSRDLYMITNGQPTGLTKDYLDYIISADGQKIVADQGYVPLTS
ncbi:MAG: phosphate ABC transporter substrate-binding protein [Methanoregula sp.]|nr:phosphate ABC transporter substrate-binding protein [Methanoregula sp.]